jgi:CheY-like chemotaxis protein
VKDEACVCKLVRSILQGHGYKIVEAASGKEATKLCRANEGLDLLITELF